MCLCLCLCAETAFCPITSAKTNNLRPEIDVLQDAPVPAGGATAAPYLVQKVPLGAPVAMGSTAGSVRISSPGRLEHSRTAAESAAISLLILSLALGVLFAFSMLVIATVRSKSKKSPFQPFDYFSLSYTTPYNLPVTNIKKQKGFTASGMGIVFCVGLAAAVVANAVLSTAQEKIELTPFGVSTQFESATNMMLEVRFYGTDKSRACQGDANQSSCVDAVQLGVAGFSFADKPGKFTCQMVQGEYCLVSPAHLDSASASRRVHRRCGIMERRRAAAMLANSVPHCCLFVAHLGQLRLPTLVGLRCRSRGAATTAACFRRISRQRARMTRSSTRPSPSK